MELIDKDYAVALIKKRKKDWQYGSSTEAKYKKEECDDVLSLLDTLEVKEMDLESNSFDATVCKIGSTYLKEMERDAIVKALEPYKNGDKVKVIIKAQKGEWYEGRRSGNGALLYNMCTRQTWL
jgi:hypothetical protein